MISLYLNDNRDADKCGAKATDYYEKSTFVVFFQKTVAFMSPVGYKAY
jgi:hypothetical protein